MDDQSLLTLLIIFSSVFLLLWILTSLYCYIKISQKINTFWFYLNTYLCLLLISNSYLIMLYFEETGWFIDKGEGERNLKEIVKQLHIQDFLAHIVYQFISLFISIGICFLKFTLHRKKIMNVLLSWLIFLGVFIKTVLVVEEDSVYLKLLYIVGVLISVIVLVLLVYFKGSNTKYSEQFKFDLLVKKAIFDFNYLSIMFIILILSSDYYIKKVIMDFTMFVYTIIMISLLQRYDSTKGVVTWKLYKAIFFIFKVENFVLDFSEDGNSSNYQPPLRNSYKEESDTAEELNEEIPFIIFNLIKGYYARSSEIIKGERKNKKNTPNTPSGGALLNSSPEDKDREKDKEKSRKSKLAVLNNFDERNSKLTFGLSEIIANNLPNTSLFESYYNNIKKAFDLRFRTKAHSMFEIQSINIENFDELMVLFNVNYKAIIESFDPLRNAGIFRVFAGEQQTLYNTSESNVKEYWTKDLLFLIEIHEYSSEEELFDLERFTTRYKDFIKQKNAEFNFTFLPLILGVFRVKIFNSDKILILYRHPYAFSTFHPLKPWFLSSLDDSVIYEGKSSNKEEAITCLKDIEMENISLVQTDFDAFEACLERDINFLKTNDLYPKFEFNIFIINDMFHQMSIIGKGATAQRNVAGNEEQYARQSIMSKKDKKEGNGNSLTDIIENSACFDMKLDNSSKSKTDSNNNVKRQNANHFENPSLCELERLMFSNKISSRYIMKFFFMNIIGIGAKKNNLKTFKNQIFNNQFDQGRRAMYSESFENEEDFKLYIESFKKNVFKYIKKKLKKESSNSNTSGVTNFSHEGKTADRISINFR